MNFKSNKQRKAVMAKLNYSQLRKRGINLKPFKDTDKDGVVNIKDCKPLNPKEQGIIHNIVAGMGRIGGHTVGELKSGWKDIPAAYKRSKLLTMEKQELKEAQRDMKALRTIARNKERIKNLKQTDIKSISQIAKQKQDISRLKNVRMRLITQLQKGEIGFVKRKNKLVAVRTQIPG